MEETYFNSFSRWTENLVIKEIEFINVPLWIQLWDVPEHCKTKNLAEKVGSSLGKVLDVDLFRLRGGEERILKVKILLEITKPLRRNLKISGSNDSVAGKAQDEKWGQWLRAEQSGWRIEKQKENANPNGTTNSAETPQQQWKPTPINLLREFANLSIQKDTSQARIDVSKNQVVNEVMEGNKEDVADSQEVIQIKETTITNEQVFSPLVTTECEFATGSNNV
ncbi:hypothetical protein PIB30_019223 [Stylosanthes scabra]|uniref:DUF4283 domain-containing protein n=1 Tax=Stylosanthes scabra TaxID=79078 RepID=A0ABU6Q8X0_9FABA|nr:hypothetical protein [Stylosanthes scabra]